MRLLRGFVVAIVAVIAVAVGIIKLFPARPAWVVAGVSRDGTILTVAVPETFSTCTGAPRVSVSSESTRAVRINARFPRGNWDALCASDVGRTFGPFRVRLEKPLAGRAIEGKGQARVPTGSSSGFTGVMPSIVGMNVEAARGALSHAGYPDQALPDAPPRMVVRTQAPAAGAELRIHHSTNGATDGTYVTGPVVVLGLSNPGP